ncbi:MAG TPA: BCAM0308 family protein [Terrimicrobiaceae bacterium]
MPQKSETAAATRKDRLIRERVHDPYQASSKLPEPTVCPICGATYHEGRWQWMTSQPAGAHRHTCEACRRIRDRYPAGVITLRGGFVSGHRNDLLRLVRNNESFEKQEHPLNRIIRIEERPDSIVITTTDIHLPHRIAEALRNAYKGELEIRYDKEGYFARVEWQRES